MWCNQTKQVICQAIHNLSFLVEYVKQKMNYILLKSLSKLGLWFQRYKQFSEILHNEIEKEWNTIMDCISKLIFPTMHYIMIKTHFSL